MIRSWSQRALVVLWLLSNIIFAFGHPCLGLIDEIGLHSFAVCLVLFLLPGAGIFAVPGQPLSDGVYPSRPMSWAACAWVVSVLLASISFHIGTITVLTLFNIEITPCVVWNVIWCSTNIIFIIRFLAAAHGDASLALSGSGTFSKTFLSALFILVFTASYLLYAWGASRVVPPDVDNDLEVQGTAYSLIHRFEPLLATDRSTLYYFAHPPLLHVYVGFYFFYTNQLNMVKHYYDATISAIEVEKGIRPPQFSVGDKIGRFEIIERSGEDFLIVKTSDARWRRVVPYRMLEVERYKARFAQSPALWPTRVPTMFLAALTVGLLAIWASEASRSWILGLAAAAAYGSNPEVFVRSSYGGYFGISNLAIVLMLCLSPAVEIKAKPHRFYAACASGVFAALADHKLLLFPLAFSLWELVRPSDDTWRQRAWQSLIYPTTLGFGLGTALFWAYGFLISPSAFWEDHVRNHLVDRLVHINPLGYSNYPSVGALWLEFAQHTGYVLLPLAVVLLVLTISRGSARGVPAQGLNPPQPTAAWLLWLGLTAVAFSAVDWRQTKHLMPLLPMLCLAPALWAGRKFNRTIAVIAAYAWLIVYQAYWLMRLAIDFRSLAVVPSW